PLNRALNAFNNLEFRVLKKLVHKMKSLDIEYAIIVLERDSTFIEKLRRVQNGNVLHSIWKDSELHSDYIYRVDPPDPQRNGQAHVHIAKRKHKKTKDMQASWNIDGSRHDKKSFNETVGKRSAVKEIAAGQLGIDPSKLQILLEQDIAKFLR
ncbi:hypothetical protein PO25_17625, partial [Vibrio anguillarum]